MKIEYSLINVSSAYLQISKQLIYCLGIDKNNYKPRSNIRPPKKTKDVK